MIDIYIRHVDNADAMLFNSVDNIDEIYKTIDFVKNTDIINIEGAEFTYFTHQIEYAENITVEIIIE